MHSALFHLKPDLQHALGKCRIRECRPYGDYAAGFECIVGMVQPAQAIQGIIIVTGESIRPVVDIQHDGIKAVLVLLHDLADVLLDNLNTFVVKRESGNAAQMFAVPAHDGRHQFGYRDARRRTGMRKSRSQCETHAEAAHQQLRGIPARNMFTCQFRQGIFRIVETAVHQFALPVDADRILFTALVKPQGGAAVGGGIDQDIGVHGCPRLVSFMSNACGRAVSRPAGYPPGTRSDRPCAGRGGRSISR